MSKPFAALIAGGAILVSSLPSVALAAPRPDRDVRASKWAAVPAATVAARGAQARRLGPSATVSTQAGTGALHLLQRTDGMLTGPSSKDPKTIALDYVRAHADVFGLGARDLAALDLTQDTRSPDGLTHLRWAQTVDGVRVYDTDLTAHLDSDGRLASFSGDALPGLTLDTTSPTLTAQDARARAATYAGGSPGGAGSPRLVAFPLDGAARLAWEVTATGEAPFTYDVVVDATNGDLLRRRNLTEFANAQVWGRFPGAPNGGGTASTVSLNGWLTNAADTTQLAGPNAHVYSDVDGSDSASAGEEIPASGGSDWLYTPTAFPTPFGQTCPVSGGCTWDPNSASSYTTNRTQVGTQVFFFVNRFHDHLKANPIGFDSASGAFEGSGRLNAEPDDTAALGTGANYNNANMSTPTDGSSPRMQMYLFNDPFNAINGGDAADIVYHEYTHGLSNRLVRDLDRVEGGAMGEGWSDWYALDYLNAQGYAPDNPNSPGELELAAPYVGTGNLLRFEPIDCPVGASSGPCPGSQYGGTGGFTYGDVGNILGPNVFETHADGEAWAQTLWDLRTSLGSPIAETLVTGGMRLSPRSPSFLDERDAILQEDVAAFSGLHVGAIWNVFAARGMGYAASRGTQDFSLPPRFDLPRTTIDDSAGLGNNDGILSPGESARLTVTARNRGAATTDTAATLTSTDPSQATVTQPSTSFGTTWAAGSDATTATPVTVSVPSSTACGTTLPLRFTVAGATLDPQITVGLRDVPATFVAPDTPKTITDAVGPIEASLPRMTTSTINVPAGYGSVSALRLGLDITHAFDADLIIAVTHAGRTATLVNSRGPGGDDFTSTVFSDAATAAIGAGAAPFTGTFRPETPLAAFDGTDSAGPWTLRLYDQFHTDEGTLNNWSLRVPTCNGGSGGGGGGGGGTTGTTATVPPPVESGTNPAPPVENGSNPPAVDPSLTPPPLDPRISLLKAPKTLRLARNRSFNYTFAARPGASGTVTFATAKAVAPRRGAARRKVVLKVANWVASTRGVVTVHAVLSPANAKLVKTLKAVPVTVTVAGGTKKVAGTVRLLKPR